MRAIAYRTQGLAREVLELIDLPMPEPQSGELLVRLRTSGVNPSDVKMRSGAVGVKPPFPLIVPHSDGAGVIEAVGQGVNPGRVGERVWLWNAAWKRVHGTAADYIALPAEQAVRLPEHISFEAGACLGIPLMTAVHALNLSGANEGDAILVSGGAGSVGRYAVQAAARRGIRVIATVSGTKKADIALQAGAAATIDYKLEDIGARVSTLTGGAGVKSVIEVDLNANASLIPSILAPHGCVVAYGISDAFAQIPTRWMLQNSIGIKLFIVYELTREDRCRVIEDMDLLLMDDRLSHSIAETLPLREAARAHELVEANAPGKVVLNID